LRTRDFRRFQLEKKKKRVRKFLWWLNKHYYTDKEKQVMIGVRANTPQKCSCMSCGNIPRKYGVTRQEVKSSLNALDDLDNQEEWLYNRNMVKNLDLNYCDPWGYD
jgi:hypothetical protein